VSNRTRVAGRRQRLRRDSLDLQGATGRVFKIDVSTDWSQRLTALGTLVTLFVAVTALWLSHQSDQRQAHLVEQGQITDRFSKAVEQLGSGKPDVEMGGAYALQRIMNDSDVDRPAVVRILSAYVRSHAPSRGVSPGERIERDVHPPTSAVLAVLDILSERPNPQARPVVDLHRVNLSYANLTRIKLSNVNLSGANLNSASLRGADLTRAKLDGAIFSFASLDGAQLLDSDLTGANLGGAHLDGADLENARLEGAFLSYATLDGTNLLNAVLSYADLSHVDLTNANVRGLQLRSSILAGTALTPVQKRSAGPGISR
jgi:hypothetical protein